MDAATPELRLLLACSRASTNRDQEVAIQEILGQGIDWTQFTQKAVEHQLAQLAGRTLARVAGDLVPENVLDAYHITIERARVRNRMLFDKLGQLNAVLVKNGIEAITLAGPPFAIQELGDLGLRINAGLDLLVRDSDVIPATRLVVAGHAKDVAVNVHSRIAPIEMVLDINHNELWQRARRVTFNGHTVTTLAPEDHLVFLATHGCQEMWRNVRRVCDVTALIDSHPQLDWIAILERARAQGYLRMLLLAASLSRQYFGADLPRAVKKVEDADSTMAMRVAHVLAQWQVGTRACDAKAFSMNVLRLHNGTVRQGRYLARAVLWQRHLSPLSVNRTLRALPIKTTYHGLIAELSPVYSRLRKLTERRHASDDTITQGPNAAASPVPADIKNTWTIQAEKLLSSNRFAEAVEASDSALKIDPTDMIAMRLGVEARLKSCDWRRLEEDKQWLRDCLRTQPKFLGPHPFFIQCFGFGNPETRLLNNDPHFVERHKALPEPLWRGETYRHDKIRLGYVSTNFQDPMARSVIEVLEHHDRRNFETTAISLGPTKLMEGRIEAAFDKFIDVRKLAHAEIATMLRDMEIDIAIDLYTGARDTRIFAARPAPVQVNYPGYPGTLGVPYIDYIIADRIVIPEEDQSYFSENVVYMPHSYQPNDRKRPFAITTPSRCAVGLPETGFVFASFNSTYKITPEMFQIWMRLLHDVEGSVLWLYEDNVASVINLRRQAREWGIDAERLVFARYMKPAQHLAQQSLADLFLDTLPINGQATASDALWGGLPVLTCAGDIFSGRVAASLLQALGLPELVTNSLASYEQLARSLAQDPERLAAIKAKLKRNRGTEPLFDTPRYTRYLESAFTTMWERSAAALPPRGFTLRSTLPNRLTECGGGMV